MKELLKETVKSIKSELKRANKKFPLFASDHEGYAVMLEEFEEAKSELLHAEYLLEELKIKIFSDCSDESKGAAIRDLRETSRNLVAESTQFSAMVEKFTMSKISRIVCGKAGEKNE